MKIKTLIILVVTLALSLTIGISFKRISNLKNENTRLLNNQQTLLLENNAILAECNKYKVSDSLNAYKVSELRLTLEEYKKYRNNDLALIKKLKLDKADMQKVIDSQHETIYKLSAETKDTVIVKDTIHIDAKAFEYKSKWIDINGIIYDSKVEMDINNREALTVVESVEYKRFWGFLWKTKKIKRRDVDIISKNPNTEIIDVDFVSIEQ